MQYLLQTLMSVRSPTVAAVTTALTVKGAMSAPVEMATCCWKTRDRVKTETSAWLIRATTSASTCKERSSASASQGIRWEKMELHAEVNFCLKKIALFSSWSL